VVDRLSQRALRTYLKGGRKAWAEVSAGNELAALERIKPELAASYADGVRMVTRTRRRGKTRAAAAS
jgi:hypothetical protein